LKYSKINDIARKEDTKEDTRNKASKQNKNLVAVKDWYKI